jgi:nitrous oxide reductase accessory protein NosL
MERSRRAATELAMHRIVIALAFAVALAVAAIAGAARADHPLADVKEGPSCRRCGMDRAKFASSRMVVEYDDGSKLAACSLHCVAVDLAGQYDRSPLAIRVGDLETQELLDAEEAVWVVGGSRPGVMSRRGKWAFADRARAEAFAKANGGTVAGFEDAMRAAYEDMYEDSRAIRERRKAKRAATPASAAQPAARPQ